MKLRYKKIGEFIQLVDNKNKENKMTVDDLRGVNIDKEFMPTVANTTSLDLTKYKIVQLNQFACNLMHVMRDERLPVAFNHEKKSIIVSPAYSVFEVKDTSKLLPEYLMLNFSRAENDRLAWFKCDSSVRGGLEWNRFCEIEIPVPPIDEQRKIADLYISMRNNLECIRNSFDDLRKISESYINEIKKTKPHNRIGEFIQLIHNKNKENKMTVDDLQGVNIDKEFMPTVANTTSLDLTKYKIVQQNQFACNLMHVMRDERLPVAFNHEKKSIIVSPAYSVFEVKDTSKLLPQYLMLNFSRAENDRLAWFKCDSSVRGGLEWNRFCEIEIPVPPIDEQRTIVNAHLALRNRKEIMRKLEMQIKNLAPILIRRVNKEFEKVKA